jgi:hypothetical protein
MPHTEDAILHLRGKTQVALARPDDTAVHFKVFRRIFLALGLLPISHRVKQQILSHVAHEESNPTALLLGL